MKIQMLTCFSMLLCLSTAYAQPQKGRTLIGANFGGSTNFTERSNNANTSIKPLSSTNENSSFSISPNIDYFISDKASIGLELGYVYVKNSRKDTKPDTTLFESASNTFDIGLNHTQYFKLKGPLYLGLKNSIYGSVTERREPISYASKDLLETTTSIGYRLNVGLVYFVSDRLVLNTYINILNAYDSKSKSSYQGLDYTPTTGYTYNDKRSKSHASNLSAINSFTLSNLSIGIKYYLGKKTSTEAPQ